MQMVGHEQIIADKPAVDLSRAAPNFGKAVERGLISEQGASAVNDGSQKHNRLACERQQVRQMATLGHERTVKAVV